MGSSVVVQAANRELCVRTEDGGDAIPRPIGTFRNVANFSGGCTEAEVVDGGPAENQPRSFIIMKISKENFGRVIAGESIHMVSQEPRGGPDINWIYWRLNECTKGVKFNLCCRVRDNLDDAGKVKDYPLRRKKFYFQHYAKAKSPVIYLALKRDVSSEGSPTWKGFATTGPAAGKEKYKFDWLTQVYEGTIDDLAKEGIAKTDWLTAKRE